MRNPLRSEAEAYRFLLVTVGAAAAIVVASVAGGPWWGTGVAIVVVAGVTWLYLRQPTERETVQTAPRRHEEDDGEYRMLVVANDPYSMGDDTNGRLANTLGCFFLILLSVAGAAALPLIIITGGAI